MEEIVTGSQSSENRRKTALIVEGGAMRGAWAAGVLAFLYEHDQRQYDLVYAASSGACSAAYFVAGMLEGALTIWREHACQAIRKTNFLRRKPVVDLAFLIDYIMKDRVPLSVEAIQKAATRLYILLTDCHTGEPVYFHARDERIFDALRATSSMALATRGFDYVEGYPYADGGVSDPIPIHRALQDGATDLTVILTHGADFRFKPMPRFLGRLAYPQFPAAAEAWTSRQYLKLNAALELISKPPDGVRMRVFSPLKSMPVGGLTEAKARVEAALFSGREHAMEQISMPSPERLSERPDPIVSHSL